jgi:chromosome segregation ATPase
MADLIGVGNKLSEVLELYYTIKSQVKNLDDDVTGLRNDIRDFREKLLRIENRITALEENRNTTDSKITRIDELSRERVERIKSETSQELRTQVAEVTSSLKIDAAEAKMRLVIEVNNKLNELQNQLRLIQEITPSLPPKED